MGGAHNPPPQKKRDTEKERIKCTKADVIYIKNQLGVGGECMKMKREKLNEKVTMIHQEKEHKEAREIKQNKYKGKIMREFPRS